MPSTTPLTDAINALTTYSNTVTGASDTTLSEAVGTLVAGYGGGGGGSVLPDGYTQLLALQSSGGQYIDTGLYTKANQTYYALYEKTGTGQVNAFGNNVSGCASYNQISQNGLALWYQYGTTTYSSFAISSSVEPMSTKLDITGIYRWDASAGDYVLQASISGSSVTENQNIHNILFGRSTGAGSYQLSSVRFFRFRVEENGVPICDMYPAMRNSDKVLGMYDVARNTFYTNAGNGSFTGFAFE